MRRSPLLRKTRLRARAKPRKANPARDAWKTQEFGRCAVCGHLGYLVRHHVIYAQHVRRADPSLEWDQRNAMLLGQDCTCHASHHAAVKRIPLELVPEAAVAFAVDLLGEEFAAAYLQRRYDCGRTL